MPDINDPNGVKDTIPVHVSEAKSTGYGWVPIAICGALLLAIFILLPIGPDQPVGPNTNTQGPAKTAPITPQ